MGKANKSYLHLILIAAFVGFLFLGSNTGRFVGLDDEPLQETDLQAQSVVERYSTFLDRDGNSVTSLTTEVTSDPALESKLFSSTFTGINSGSLNRRPKLDPALTDRNGILEDGRYLSGNNIRVIVEVAPATPLTEARLRLLPVLARIPGSKLLNDLKDVNSMVVVVDIDRLEEIASLPIVDNIWLDRIYEIRLDKSIPLIGADDAWQQVDPNGNPLKGADINIAVLDTGVDYNHGDLDEGKVTRQRDLVQATGSCSDGDSDDDAMDSNGHGTHVAATAAGDGDASGGQYMGVAPDASIWAVKVLGSSGCGFSSWIYDGISWATDPNGDGDYLDRVDIISMSIGSSCTFCTGDHYLSKYLNTATERGTLVVVAAGNSGRALYDEFSITSPGDAEKALTVAATDDFDKRGYFSSKGPRGDYKLKPDIAAPGVGICAAQWDSFASGSACGPKHVSISGTSMATPHVAGAAALLKQMHPSWTPTELKAALTLTARDIGLKPTEQGSGRLDIIRALEVPIFTNKTNLAFLGNSEILKVTNKGSSGITLDIIIDDARNDKDGNYYPILNSDKSRITIPAGGSDTITFTAVSPSVSLAYTFFAQGVIRLVDANNSSYRVPYTSNVTNVPKDTPENRALIFTTSTSYTGDLGGLNGADIKCQERADAAGLPGTYKAFLSTDDFNVRERINDVCENYVLYTTGGTPVAYDCKDLWDGRLKNPIRYDEFGNLINRDVRTGSQDDGNFCWANHTCQNWEGTGSHGAWGRSYETNYLWTGCRKNSLVGFAGGLACIYQSSIYCFYSVDYSAPKGSVRINNDEDFTTVREVQLTAECKDALSSIKDVRYANEDLTWTEWEQFASERSWTLTAGDGTKTVYYECRDDELNVFRDMDSILYDTKPPEGTIAINKKDNYTNSTNVAINVLCSDPSVCSEIQFSADNLVYTEPESYYMFSDDFDSHSYADKWRIGNAAFNPKWDRVPDAVSEQGGYLRVNSDPDIWQGVFTKYFNIRGGETFVVDLSLRRGANTNLKAIKLEFVKSDFSENPVLGWNHYFNKQSDSWHWLADIPSDHFKPYRLVIDTKVGKMEIWNGDGTQLYWSKTESSWALNGSNTYSVGFVLDNSGASVDIDYFRVGSPILQRGKQWTLETGDGEKMVYAKYKDFAGHTSAATSDSIVLDTIPPSLNISRPKYYYTYVNDIETVAALTKKPNVVGKLTIEVNATDSGSGVAKTEFYINNVLRNTETSAPYQWLWNPVIPKNIGDNLITVKAQDKAGNIAPNSSIVVLVAPV